MTMTFGGRCWDFGCLRDRAWMWLEQHAGNRRRGRHAFDREMAQLDRQIAAHEHVPFTEPAPEPEWTAEAILRSARPHLYACDREYWRDQWAWMALWMADWRATSAAHRAECGLAA